MKIRCIKVIEGWKGEVLLWQTEEGNYLVTSKVMSYSGPETFIFKSDDAGKVTDWSEQDGSRTGDFTHEQVLTFAGYEVE